MKAFFNNDFTKSTNEGRLTQQKIQIIQTISQRGEGITVPEICETLQISTPTGIKLVNQLQKEGVLSIIGKKETLNGRRPVIYGLRNLTFYALSVEILLKRVSVAVIDSEFNVLYSKQNTDFELENTAACLSGIESFIHSCLKESAIPEDAILGMGIGITGRINNLTGESFSYFNFMDQPLGDYFSARFELPVFLNNDTRCFGFAEKIIGKARSARHAIVINLSRGLGTSLIIENRIVNGVMGFAGELGHMQFGRKDKICLCGKNGCLGNDVGGFALESNFLEKVAEGKKSLVKIPVDKAKFRYDKILQAALEGDNLSISLIQDMGLNLGEALGNIVNLLNPELIIIGGKFARLKDILIGPVQTGLTNSTLTSTLNHCKVEFSDLGDLAGLKGAGAHVFAHFKLIKK